MARKNIESVEVELTTSENINFLDIIRLGDQCSAVRHHRTGDSFNLKIVKEEDNYIIGVVYTAKLTGIPPKYNPNTGDFAAIQMEEGQGLGFANIFLFEKTRNILMYEFNKNGCYLEYFKGLLAHFSNNNDEWESHISFDFKAILNAQEYQRILNMRSYRSIEVNIANPDEILGQVLQQNDSISNNIRDAAEVGANNMHLKIDVGRSRIDNLDNNGIHRMVTSINNLISRDTAEENVKKVIVKGYSHDPENEGNALMSEIDLVADRYKVHFNLQEERVMSSIKLTERRDAIEELYLNHSVRDFNGIFGN